MVAQFARQPLETSRSGSYHGWVRRIAPALALLAACGQQPAPDAPSSAPAVASVPTSSAFAPAALDPSAAAPPTSAAVIPAAVPPAPVATFTPSGSPGHFTEELDVSVFQRGNIHTHTRESDGDTKVEEVYSWYRDHGYQFLAITDHNRLTDPKKYKKLERPGFVMINGEEVTMAAAGKPVHVNALCHKRAIGGGRFTTYGEALAWAVHEIRDQGGVALVNHPNFDWTLSAADLKYAKGAALLEIWSGHPHVHTDGDATRPSHEIIWETVLGEGQSFAGVAVDDMHNMSPAAVEPASHPGRGWVDVFASITSSKEICAALGNGHLVASNGVRLKHFVVKGDTMTLTPEGDARVEFIGSGGAVLETEALTHDKTSASYKLRGGEAYVRARVTAPDGKRAWTQAYRVAK